MMFFTLLSPLQSIISIFIIILSGILFTHLGIIDKNVHIGLSKLTVKLFTPCLLVTSISSTVTIGNMYKFWVLPIYALVNIITSGLIAYTIFKIKYLLIKKIPNNTKEEEQILLYKSYHTSDIICTMVIVCTFKNIISIPLPFVKNIIVNNYQIFGSSEFNNIEECILYAFSAVLIYASFANILQWTVGSIYIASSNTSSKNIKHKIKLLFSALFSVPNISIVVGLIIGIIPVLRNLFYPQSAPLYKTITISIDTIGSLTVPCLLILFGGMLYNTIMEITTDSSEKKHLSLGVFSLWKKLHHENIFSNLVIYTQTLFGCKLRGYYF